MDDGIHIVSLLTECVTIRNAILSDLGKAGLVLNVKKSQSLPQKVRVWLHFIINLEHGMFLVPQEKICKLQELGKEVAQCQWLEEEACMSSAWR